jgi:glycyl-tRNA synthetase alpha chain
MVTLQQLIFKLSEFWVSRGCLLQQPLDIEMGAGTMHPETFLRVLGPEHWNVAYVQPSRRPADGRFGENPNRLFKHHQFQVILKPAPDDVQQWYLQSLEACGIDLRSHDIRFEEDNWESPTLGAWGIGWQVLFDGQEITQFTYFQQAGGVDLSPISVELTYGLERFAMALQDVDDVFDLEWGARREIPRRAAPRGGRALEVRLRPDRHAPAELHALHRNLFDQYYGLAGTLLRSDLVLPALDYCLKCSHMFNLLDASGGIGVTERMAYILRVRQMAVAIAKRWAGIDESKD